MYAFGLHAQPNPATTKPDLGAPVELGGQRALPLTEEELNRERWLDIVSAHSGSHLGLYEPIKVTFNRPQVSAEALSSTPAPELFKLSPDAKGYTYWSAPNELSFKPQVGWETNRSYTVSLSPHPSLGDHPQLAPLTFSFIAVEPSLELSPLQLTLNAEGSEAQVGVKVTLSEQATLAQVTGLIKARQDGQPLEVSWVRGASGAQWRASLTAQRYETASELLLLIDGKSVGSSKVTRKTLKIPKTGSFEVTRVYAVSKPSERVYVELSEPLDPKQSLEGMVTSPQGELSAEVLEGRLALTPKGPVAGPVTLQIAPGLRSISGRTITQALTQHVTFQSLTPKLRSVKQGAILPSVARPLFAFETIGLRSVEITALLVKERNLGQFLQRNRLTSAKDMTHVGRYLWRKRVPLNLSATQLGGWSRHHLDLSSLLSEAPNGLLHLEVTFGRQDASVLCSEQEASVKPLKRAPLKNQEARDYDEPSAWDGGYYWGSAYEERKNPCKDAYYRRDRSGRSITQNIISSNIGVLSKKGAGPERFFAVTDLRSAQPIAGAKVSLYNFQNELLNSGVTDAEGFARIDEARAVFYARVDHQGSFGVLKLDGASRLATTHFDVGGVERADGINGALYAERGMWRPGDDIYLTFVLQDPKALLPKGHPIFVTFSNPMGAQEARFILRRGLNGFYPFSLKTAEDAPTGRWEVKVEVGATTFLKSLPVETFEPNRLQVNLRLPKTSYTSADFPTRLSVFSQWLHGAKARELPVSVELNMSRGRTAFNSAREFNFNDPTTHARRRSSTLFDGKLDQGGYAHFDWPAPSLTTFGHWNARFTTQVTEPSGATSVEYRNVGVTHGSRFVGVRLPKGDKRGMLLTDTPHQVLIKTLNAEGKPVDGAPLEIKLYKIEWRWWWDTSSESLVSVENRSYSKLLQTAQVSTVQGDAQWDLEVKSPIWGRFLLKVCELPNGHCSAQTLYIDWPGWANESGETSIGQTYLPMSLDAERYRVGDVARLKLPVMPQGRALVSIESGAHLISQRWVSLGDTETEVTIPITSGMAPNVYVNVTAMQPHARSNDKPIRLYTVLPIKVDDPRTHLKPKLELPDEVRPETEVEVKVSEEQGEAMTYTLALVDEGLLGVTAFKTPRLHSMLFKRLALGVKSWDLFDDVIGAYGGVVERLLSIGGAEALDEEEDKRRRFEPVVLYKGPFELKAGEQASHRFKLPQYVGAVRVMLVAGHQAGERFAYGSIDKKMRVRQPLMLLPNLPRVIGPEEDLTLPVSVFATSPELKRVELFSKTSDPGSFLSPRVALEFDQPSEQEQLARLTFKVGSKVGTQTLRFTAESGSWVARQKVNLPVRLANPPSSITTPVTLKAGESTVLSLQPFGIEGTRSGTLEASQVPKLHIATHLAYLLKYPHGCAEQTTSRAFPQLYLSALTRLTGAQRASAQSHVEAAIRRLKTMQTPQGDFAYWPGGDPNAWASSYVGHFLLEAQAEGYQLPQGTLDAWKARQAELARRWSGSTDSATQEEQAYRLFTLALARTPELGAMNRLRQGGALNSVARGLLARAYALSGQAEAARSLSATETALPDTGPVDVMRGFKSAMRDLALRLELHVALDDLEGSKETSELLIARLNRLQGGHTHELATALKALGVWARSIQKGGSTYGVDYLFAEQGEEPKDIDLRYLYGTELILNRPLTERELDARQLKLKNDSPYPIYLSLNRRGVPRAGEELPQSAGLKLKVTFVDERGDKVDPTQVKQGSLVIARLSVEATDTRRLGQLALTYGAPSGWLVENDRLTGRHSGESELIYQDVKDDHVSLYFELKPGEVWRHEVRLKAAFEGRFYHPATYIEAMYRPEAFALERGFWTQVTR